MSQKKVVSILGVTGSIGQSAKSILLDQKDMYSVDTVTARTRVDQLAQDAIALQAKLAVIADESQHMALKQALAGTGIEIAAGQHAVCEAAARPVDTVLGAIVGAAGLAPTIAAIKQGTTVALANKEPLVCAGELIMSLAQKHKSTLLPVDSEHSAIFQVFDAAQRSALKSLTLTASGGPFLNLPLEEMHTVTPEQAVNHPNWSMGAKISVDSATMMNKGLEVIEAAHLFHVSSDQIDVLVHPQSVVHGMVEYLDGSVLAQLGAADMRTPINVALAWPNRRPADVKRLNLIDLARLSFEAPDFERFPALALARHALDSGSGACAVLNAANECAVAAFLKKQISFVQISQVVEKALEILAADHISSVESVLALDQEARRQTHQIIDVFAQH